MAKPRTAGDSPTTFMLTKLAASGLTKADAAALALEPYSAEESASLGLQRPGVGFRIPYFSSEGERLLMFRYRYEVTEVSKGFLKGAKLRKYDQPFNTDPEIYLPRLKGINWTAIEQSEAIPVVFTEGELKSAALTKHGLATIGLGGVWSYGCKRLSQDLLPSIERFVWKGRVVYICFDSDAATNPDIVRAENRLAWHLTNRGAEVHIVRIPQEGEAKVGIDDYLVAHGGDAVDQLFADAEQWAPNRELHQLNSEVVYVFDPSMIAVYPDEWMPEAKRTSFVMTTVSKFKTELYATRKMNIVNPTTGSITQVSAAAKWVEWPGRSTVHSVTYAPGQQRIIGGQLNMWTGWGVEPKAGNLKPWNELMANHFEDSPQFKHWFEQWLAFPLQHPGYRMNVACVFWSLIQGNGKSTIGETMRRIYGNNFGVATKAALMSQFNAWTVNKQFILGEEITGGSSREAADILKNMITGHEITVNTKNVPHYVIPNCINYYFTSNHPDAFYLQHQDRRFFIHELTARKLPDSFWKEYVAWMTNGGPGALFHHLLNLDLANFDPDAAAPHTKAREEMIDAGLSQHAAWIKELREFPDNVLRVGGSPDGAVLHRGLYTIRELIDLCMPPDRYSRQISAKAFGAALREAGFKQVAKGTNIVTGPGMRQHVWAIRDPKLAELGPTAASEAYLKELNMAVKKEKFKK